VQPLKERINEERENSAESEAKEAAEATEAAKGPAPSDAKDTAA
jgi:hypothetical protein